MSRVELIKKYKSYAICNYNEQISRLRKSKVEYMKKTEEINMKIKEIEETKRSFCKATEGHTLKEEQEEGIYGERFLVCTSCGLEV